MSNETLLHRKPELASIEKYILKCKKDAMRRDMSELEKAYLMLKSKFLLNHEDISGLNKVNEEFDSFLDKFCIKSFKDKDKSEIRKKALEFVEKDLSGYTVALLICPPYDINMPSLGISSLAASITAKTNEKLIVIDLNAILCSLAYDEDFWDMEKFNVPQDEGSVGRLYSKGRIYIEKIIDNIAKSKISVLGVSFVAANTSFTMRFLEGMKKAKPKIKVIAGGAHTLLEDFNPDPKLVDYRLVGDGELLFLQALSYLKWPLFRHKPESFYRAVYDPLLIKYKNSIVKNLNDIPYPTFDEIELGLYRKNSLPVYFSRGCVRKCIFCFDWIVSGKSFRHLEPEKIVEGLKYLRNKYRINVFHLNDLLCNGDLEKLEKTCDLLIREKLGILWDCYAIIRNDMSLELMNKLRKSGCTTLHYGLDSGSSKVIKLMNKGYTSEEAQECIRNTSDSGIDVAINILVGYPGEEQENIEETKEFLIRNRQYIRSVGNVSTCFIMPKTTLQSLAKSIGITNVSSGSQDYIYEWELKDNTLDTRLERAQEILNLLEELKIPVSAVFASNRNNASVHRKTEKPISASATGRKND